MFLVLSSRSKIFLLFQGIGEKTFISWFVQVAKHTSFLDQNGNPPRGGGGAQQSFIRGVSAPMSNPLPFYIPFLTEKVPLSYTFH